MRLKRVLILLCVVASPATAREALGVYGGWGAFRDRQPPRCYAIAEPERRGGGDWQAFAAVATWPGRGTRGQLHIRLSRARRADAPVELHIGRRFARLVAGPADAWARGARTDAAIVAALRSGETLVIRTRDLRGRSFADRYALKGAATAIDAAALACAGG